MTPSHAELLRADLDELLEMASAVRTGSTGSRVTFSPKVFVPLTHLCRDKCGYCTFAQPPARVRAPFLDPDEVLDIARAGADSGCHEVLFTLGERPEERFPIAEQWLTERGYTSTVDYLVAMCRVVIEETGLLPHGNAGALHPEELARLREVTASQGMMLESLNPDLAAHAGSPDKTPARRLATLDAAGRLAIPFTTGILCGIGESRQDRLVALDAIVESHRRYGHVQEVIVQNFLPKPGTSMHSAPPCPPEEYLWSVAAARLVLPPDVHLQAPPNLSDDFGRLLDAGIDDWGGVSPVTPDHVNPERPWPAIDRLRSATEARGLALAPRLTIYPSFVHAPERWLDARMHFPVMDHSDAEGLAREPGESWYSGVEADPPLLIDAEWRQLPAGVGSASPPKKFATRRRDADDAVTTEAFGRLVANFSGGEQPAAERQAQRRRRLRAERGQLIRAERGHVNEILTGVMLGQEAGIDEIVTLFSARGPEVADVAAVADDLRRQLVGDVVTFVRNRNINYTNVCTFKCKFCAFSKGPLSLNLRGTPYLLEVDEITRRVAEAEELGATEVCLQGGIHPSFDGDYYIDVIKAVREASATIHIHGFTALEVTEGAKRLGEPLDSYLRRLMDAGLKTLPGTAAEILDDEIRAILCPDKVDTQEWLDAHRTAHSVGLRSNITIMFGSVEQPLHWARHLVRTRDLQAETGGFTEFVPLPFVHMASPIYLQRKSRRGPTFRETLLMHAVGRIAYGALVPNVQVSWVKIGAAGARQILSSGANDLGGTLMDENISRAAGAAHGQLMDEDGFHAIADPLGRPLEQRTTLYDRVAAAPA